MADMEARPLLSEARDVVLTHEPNGDGSSTSRVYGTIQLSQENGLSHHAGGTLLNGAKGQNEEASNEDGLPNDSRSWLSKIKRLRVSRPSRRASCKRKYSIGKRRC